MFIIGVPAALPTAARAVTSLYIFAAQGVPAACRQHFVRRSRRLRCAARRHLHPVKRCPPAVPGQNRAGRQGDSPGLRQRPGFAFDDRPPALRQVAPPGAVPFTPGLLNVAGVVCDYRFRESVFRGGWCCGVLTARTAVVAAQESVALAATLRVLAMLRPYRLDAGAGRVNSGYGGCAVTGHWLSPRVGARGWGVGISHRIFLR